MPRFGATLLAVCAAGVLSIPAPARARPADRNFWDWVSDPNSREITAVMQHVEQILGLTRDEPLDGPGGAAARTLLEDAYGMLRYARSLEPDRYDVLFSLAEVADLLGRTDVAIGALEHGLATAPEEHQTYDARLRLGLLYAERGDLDRAATQLRAAINEAPPGMLTYARALPALAGVYMEQGRLDRAIDALEASDRTTVRLFDGNLMIPLSLAVAYDRDDQRSRAYAVLAKLTQADRMIERLLRSSRGGLGAVRFVDPRERHYYIALLCEATGMLDEARAEWLTYAAASPHSRYAARARIHARDILELQRKDHSARPEDKP